MPDPQKGGSGRQTGQSPQKDGYHCPEAYNQGQVLMLAIQYHPHQVSQVTGHCTGTFHERI
jgi:hypothetical protein